MSETNARRWLSENATALLTDPSLSADAQGFHCDVLIVGSGYGGAVAAARLAGSNVGSSIARVFVLERGNEYRPGMFPGSWSEIPGHVRFNHDGGRPARGVATGLFDLRLGEDVNVVVANGLGGGSLINAAVMERPSNDAFGIGWPGGLARRRDALDQAFERAERMLTLARIDEPLVPERPWLPRKTSRIFDLADRLRSARARTVRLAISRAEATAGDDVPMAACNDCGDCVSGCNVGAKRSLDTNYLFQARRRGARMFCGATVRRLAQAGAGWTIEWFLSDPGVSACDKVLHRLRSRYVILAAGVMGSTEILFRSRAAGLPISAQLGKRFSSNGDAIAAVHGAHLPADCRSPAAVGVVSGQPPPADRLVPRPIGPTITAMARVPVRGARPITIQEFAIPSSLARVLDEVVTTQAALRGLFAFDWRRRGRASSDPMAIDEQRMRHTMVYGMMGDDGAAGQIEACPSDARFANDIFDGQVRVRWPELRDAPVFDQQIALLEHVHHRKGLGGKVIVNPTWQPITAVLPLATQRGPATTVHPLGGCPMGDTAVDGVVDLYGRVFDERTGGFLRGLAVLDGSIVPVSLGINPALTIAALAEMAVPELIRDWQLLIPASLSLQPVSGTWLRASRTSPIAPKRPVPTKTSVAIREWSTGTLRIGSADYRALLKVRFADIPDLVGFSQDARRSLTIRSARLSLVGKDDPRERWEISLRGHARLLDEQPSSVLARVWRGYGTTSRRIREFVGDANSLGWGMRILSLRLASQVGGIRGMHYRFEVRRLVRRGPKAVGVAPASAQLAVAVGDSLILDKRIAFDDVGNPWLQLSSGELLHHRGPLEWFEEASSALGRLSLDLNEMADSMRPLLKVRRQPDQPSALADLASLGLFVLRASLQIHAINLLWPREPLDRQPDRFPGELDGVHPDVHTLEVDDGRHRIRLSRYRRKADGASRRVVLMIHGIGASGSTFAHRSIPGNAVRTMLGRGREVWVLDLRTSIALEQRRPWSFEEVAREDIPLAVEHIRRTLEHEQTPRKIDVIAHCIGAAMFFMAMMSDPKVPANTHWSANIGSIVLSQVGPLVRLSPYNRFRGFVANYLKQFLQVRTLDVLAPDSPMAGSAVDALLATFPYDEGADDDERGFGEPAADSGARRERERERRARIGAFARARHRADGIFGQLMHLPSMADETLKHLTAIYGWVRTEVIAQVIQFAKHDIITDVNGNNQWITDESIRRRLDRPVMFVHGERNAVFDWRGAVDSVRLLRQTFDGSPWPSTLGDSPRRRTGMSSRGGPMTSIPSRMSLRERRLLGLKTMPGGWRASSRRFHAVIVADHGHQDCMIGERAGSTVFDLIGRFFDEQWPAASASAPATSAARGGVGIGVLGVDVPRVGPIIGSVRRLDDVRLVLRVLAAHRPQRTKSWGICLVPCKAASVPPSPDHYLSDDMQVVVGGEGEHGDLFELNIAEALLSKYPQWLVLTLHEDFPGRIADLPPAMRTMFVRDELLDPRPIARAAFDEALAQGRFGEFARAGHLVVERAWIDAASTDAAVAMHLRFLVGSCHYPAGLFDRDVAQASHRRMLARLARRSHKGAKIHANDRDQPQFLVLAGDQVYVDDAAGVFDPADFGDRYSGAYERTFQLPALRDVMRRLPVYPILDDHEVVDNWERGRRPPDVDLKQALDSYERWQHRLVSASGRQPCYSYSFRPGGLPFFVLDTRTARSGRSLIRHSNPSLALPEPAQARMLHWNTERTLLKWLSENPALPKFIVTSSAVFPLRVEALADDPGEWLTLDDWGGYPATLFAVLEHIRRNAIRHVVFISGDLHLSLVSRLTMSDDDGNPVVVHSVVSSGLHSPWPFANTRPDDLVTHGSFPLREPGVPRDRWPMVDIATPLLVTHEGFACIDVDRDPQSRQWRLSVEFDQSTGIYAWRGPLD